MRGDTHMRRHDERRHDDEHEMSTLVGGAASAADPEHTALGDPPGDPKFMKNSLIF